MNKVILSGRVVAEPKVVEKLHNIVIFRLAVDRGYKGEKTDFFLCKAYGKKGDLVLDKLYKGVKIIVVGSVNTYTKIVDTKKFYYTEIQISDFDIMEHTKGYRELKLNKKDNNQGKYYNSMMLNNRYRRN